MMTNLYDFDQRVIAGFLAKNPDYKYSRDQLTICGMAEGGVVTIYCFDPDDVDVSIEDIETIYPNTAERYALEGELILLREEVTKFRALQSQCIPTLSSLSAGRTIEQQLDDHLDRHPTIYPSYTKYKDEQGVYWTLWSEVSVALEIWIAVEGEPSRADVDRVRKLAVAALETDKLDEYFEVWGDLWEYMPHIFSTHAPTLDVKAYAADEVILEFPTAISKHVPAK